MISGLSNSSQAGETWQLAAQSAVFGLGGLGAPTAARPNVTKYCLGGSAATLPLSASPFSAHGFALG